MDNDEPTKPTTAGDEVDDVTNHESEYVDTQGNRKWIPNSQYKRNKNKLKKQSISVVFNNSKIELTEPMTKILNRGLKFSVLPLKMDLTQLLTEFRRHERTMVWKEFWYNSENDEAYEAPIFKEKKSNFPRNHSAPKGLQDYLVAVKSEILDPKNRYKVDTNISEEEKEALKELIKLQKERKIVIRPCDKGAGIIILDFEEYIKACQEHLESKTDTGENYYINVDDHTLEEARTKITNIVKEGYDNELLSKQEYAAMTPGESVIPGRFYALFKVHKEYEHGKAPPVRAIVSCSGTFSENIAIYVDHHLKELGVSHPSYLQDTPDFLRQLQDINQKETLPENALLVVIDAIGLYTNIPQEEGVLCVEEALEQRVNTKVPSKYIARLLEIILQYSLFEFNEKKYQQKVGTSMGTKPAPSYANIFLANKIDRQFWKIAEKYMENGQIPLKFMRRFLDDIFMIFIGTVRQLHLFFEELNQVHPTMKFTMTHTTPKLNQIRASECDCPQIEAIPFLDTLCQIKEGKICTDLYRKPTDRNQYLLPSSCHNLKVTTSIPFSLGMHINSVCSETENRDLRLQEMKEMLLERDYTPGLIDAAISRTKAISRDQALKLVLRQPTQQRPTFVVSYDPRLPSIPSGTKKHWRSMVSQDKYLDKMFPEPSLIAFKCLKNLRETL